jgi:hypothetical protein
MVRALTALVLALVVAGCSSSDRVLVQAGSQQVTVADFDRAAKASAPQYPGTPAEATNELVGDLQRRAVMLEFAHRRGDDTTALVRSTWADDERRALLQALYTRVAPQAQPVSEAEARSLYAARGIEAHVHMLYSSSEPHILQAKARIEAGEPFEHVAAENSLLGFLPESGDMSWVAPGALPDPLDGAMRTLPVGEVGGPYHMPEGWFLMSISERRPRSQPQWELAQASMVDLARQRKYRAAFTRAYADMKTAYDVKLVPGGAQLLFRVSSPVDPLRPTPEQLARPIATYRGGVYSLGDAWDDLNRYGAQQPPPNVLPAIELWIEAQVMSRVAVLEARHRALDQEPNLVASLRAKRDQGLLEEVYRFATASVPPAGPEQVQQAWKALQPRFTRLASVQLAVLESPDSALVRQVAVEASQAPDLAAAAAKVPGAPAPTEIEVKYPTQDPMWTMLEAFFTSQPVGASYGPARSATGWRLVRVLEKQLSTQRWEDLPEGTRQNIAASASEVARDQAFRAFTDSLANAYGAHIDAAVLASLRWPEAPAPRLPLTGAPLDTGE